MSQQRSSAATSQRQVPALIKIGDARGYWRRRTINLDLGGGKYELTTEALAYRGVYSRVTDPFNRSAAHNIDVAEWVKRYNGVDTVTCANVLNVIDSAYAIGTVIRETMARHLVTTRDEYRHLAGEPAYVELRRSGVRSVQPR